MTLDKITLHSKLETSQDGWVLVTVYGAIDENSDLRGLFAQLKSDVLMNMRDVERVNSMGVHGWVPQITKLSAEHRVLIDEISYPLVQNANTVANMFGSAQVRSCMAPYFCAKCKDNMSIAVSAKDVADAGNEPPAKHCPRCRTLMEFDELDGYFDFFRTRPRK